MPGRRRRVEPEWLRPALLRGLKLVGIIMFMMLALWLTSTGAVVAKPPQLMIQGLGEVSGTAAIVKGVARFAGIPYAEPPINALRWQPPVTKRPWFPRVLDATSFGSKCTQGLNGTGSEDCLFLNVYTPTFALHEPEQRNLPVMLFIHGGAYVEGSGDTYPGETLVEPEANPVVVVTINYRLNVFGFLCGKEVMQRSRQCNFGLEDQRLALAWAKKHISAFGGSGEAITIFGESAGGNSVINHIAAEASAGLFARAIVESGACE